MPLRVYELSRQDSADEALIPRISNIHLAAWLTNAIYRAIYYGPPSSHAAIIEANHVRHMTALKTNPSTHYAVVLDPSIDAAAHNDSSTLMPSQIIAWMKYDIFESAEAEEQRTDTGPRTWPPYTNLALVNNFWEMIVDSRKRTGGNIGAHVSVDLLATDPRHQRRGAGRLLMDHVVQKADQLGLPMTLEGSPEGLKLYMSVGFVPKDEFWVDLERFADGGDKGEEWALQNQRRPGMGAGWYKQVVMVRQPRPKTGFTSSMMTRFSCDHQKCLLFHKIQAQKLPTIPRITHMDIAGIFEVLLIVDWQYF